MVEHTALTWFLVVNYSFRAQEIEAVSVRTRKKPGYTLINLQIACRTFMMRGKDSVSIYYCHAGAFV